MNPIKREINKIQLLEQLTSEIWKLLNNKQKDEWNNIYIQLFYNRVDLTEKQIKQEFIIFCYDNDINLNT